MDSVMEAAKRRRKGDYQFDDCGQLTRESLDQINQDNNDISDWALPLLDGTPIDEAWLRSVGFTEERPVEFFPPHFKIRFREIPGEGCDQFCYLDISAPSEEHRDWGFHATIAAGGCYPGPLASRGDVARLCLALGITLKEQPNA